MTQFDHLTADYRRHGLAGRVGFGERPALLVTDFIKAYTTPGSPLYAAPGVPDAIRASQPVLAAARTAAILIIYTTVAYAPDGRDGGIFVLKVPALRQLTHNSPLTEIVDELRPQPDELVIEKKYASAFFGTHLAATLTALRVDTLILIGCSTSGCIRATAVDGMQHGFRVIVPRECVGDRAPEPHFANLFDIDGKYGDVVSAAEVIHYLGRFRR
ncbi:MAG: N-carbamoylsarcosine amidohydrolase [Roseiflexus sp.]|nr:N-carbamoylsarcosine amidohydrolase [Roseiflexus sp.]MCS7289610.1 N-carbamoylsarcosine amidohydrolase [Roseiflexus sp.]MDW8146372.1 N-carbamoylsarcosine amidohydrolase [Roseiflexaceae bacterium]MDW8233204.1 N-carbamoylsarcosine amidohydrolase [Roseiflexaceae bacterium]